MFIIRLIRYLFGYVNFRAFGGFSDRFLNLCTRDAIPLWNIKNIKGNISASTTINGYLSIRRSARKSGMRVVVLEKKGLIFFLKRNKIRVGILIGAVVFTLVISILSQFVWSVSVVGNINLEDEFLLSVFEMHGVKPGAYIHTLDEKDIAQTVVDEVEQLSWAAVNRKGASVVIEVREKVSVPKKYDSDTPTNLIASEDGVILSIDALYGNEEVKPGSAVAKGDLLISGIVTYANTTEKYIHADGYVRALVKRKESFNSNSFSVFEQTKEKTRKVLFFFGIKIPLGSSVGDSFYTDHKSFLEDEKNQLPLGIITEYSAEFYESPIEINEKTKEMLALWNSACFVKELLDYSDVKKSSVIRKDVLSGTEFDFYGECEQEIGALQEIYVEKNDDNT